MIQSMKNGKHTTSSQLWAGILRKDEWLKREEKFFLEPHSWSVYTFKYDVISDVGIFSLALVLLCMLFLHIFQFGKLPGFFPIHWIQEKQSYGIYSKNSTHQSMQRAPFLSSDAHSLVFKSTQWFSFNFEWWNSIYCVLLALDLFLHSTDQRETTL